MRFIDFCSHPIMCIIRHMKQKGIKLKGFTHVRCNMEHERPQPVMRSRDSCPNPLFKYNRPYYMAGPSDQHLQGEVMMQIAPLHAEYKPNLSFLSLLDPLASPCSNEHVLSVATVALWHTRRWGGADTYKGAPPPPPPPPPKKKLQHIYTCTCPSIAF